MLEIERSGKRALAQTDKAEPAPQHLQPSTSGTPVVASTKWRTSQTVCMGPSISLKEQHCNCRARSLCVSSQSHTSVRIACTSPTAGLLLNILYKSLLNAQSTPRLAAANERTFLAWLHMAITMGGIITALASFSVETENEAKQTPGSSPVTKRTTEAIQLMLLPISIGMVAYALFTFYWRSRCMERKQASHSENVCKLYRPQQPSATCSWSVIEEGP